MFLGIDTSNYTTSVAVYGENTLVNSRKILPVKEGQRGLRQSDAVFLHIKQIPEVFGAVAPYMDKIEGVSVSTKPRNVEGSYMPVFTAGESFAEVVALSLGVPLFKFSHQDGHIMAGVFSANAKELLKKPFLSVHLSGGTTEILRSCYTGDRFENEIVGKTLDISAGQLIDRVGVALGMRFPCGKEIDALSKQSQNPVKLPVSVKETEINFSGAETKASQMAQSCAKEDLSLGTLVCVSKSLTKALEACLEKYDLNSVLLVGGVASNSFLREHIKQNLKAKIYFASTELSSDNAVGTAILGAVKAKGD